MLKQFILLFTILFSSINGYEKKDEAETETEVDEEVEKSLNEKLDENLETMNKLLKSDDEELNKSGKKKKPRDRGNLEKDDEDDEDDEKEKDDDEDDEKEWDDKDDEDEEPKKKKGKAKKMKKSLDEFIEDNEEIIDGIPVLKSFAKIIGEQIEMIGELKSEISDLRKSQDVMLKLQRSFGEVVSNEAELIKSFAGDIETAVKKPNPLKGAIKRSDILRKSEGEGKEFPYSKAEIRHALLKSCQAGEIESGKITRWEISGYNMNLIDENTMVRIKKHLPNKEEV